MFVDNVNHRIDNDLYLKGSIQNEHEIPVYKNFKQTISYGVKRYVTALPFKPYHKPLFENYTLSKHCLSVLKTKLDKNKELKQEYNKVFDDYLKDGIIERVTKKIMGWLEKPITVASGSCLV